MSQTSGKVSVRVEAPDGGIYWVNISKRDLLLILGRLHKVNTADAVLHRKLWNALEFYEGKQPLTRRTTPPLPEGTDGYT